LISRQIIKLISSQTFIFGATAISWPGPPHSRGF